MFVFMSKEEILKLEEKGKVQLFSLWDSLDGAREYYSKKKGRYAAYEESRELLTHAYSTPIKVFHFLDRRKVFNVRRT
ncbi:hypothetical protein [Effusibacillus consociatus]